MSKSRLRSIKKAGRLAGAAKGIFKKVGAKLKTAKNLANKGVPAPRTPRTPTTGKPFLKPPRKIKPGAAPYRPEFADRVPRYGTKGKKTTGVVDLGGERVIGLDSGKNGPSASLPKPRRGMDGNVVTHVEAHTVATMRQNGVKEATLYINQAPCEYAGPGGRPSGCAVLLQRMLKPGEKLTVYGPNGYHEVFVGK